MPSISSPRTTRRTLSRPRSPVSFSPALSLNHKLRPHPSAFMGQSPAPVFRTLPILSGTSCPSGQLRSSSSPSTHLPNPSITTISDRSTSKASIKTQYRQAEEDWLLEDVSRMQATHGSFHDHTLSLLQELTLFMEQGRYTKAEGVARRLVESCRLTNADELNTLDSVSLLAQVFALQGLYAQAEQLLQRVVKSQYVILDANTRNHYTV
jgi:hypothetical protein